MGKLWEKTVGADGKSKLDEIDLSKLDISQPTVVYLSGFLTNNNRPDYVAGSLKRMEELIRGRSEIAVQPKLYGWSHTSLKNLFNLALYDSMPNKRSSDAGFDLGAGVLMPLVAKDFKRNEDGSVSGTPVSVAEAKEKLRNVTFFGYSAGSIVAQETYNATLKMMKQVGWKEGEAKDALHEVALVAVGAISRPSHETDRFRTVYLVASNDRINRGKNWIWGALGTALRTVFGRYASEKHTKDLTIRPLSETSVFASTAVRPTYYEWKYDEQGEKKEKKWFDPLYPKWAGRRSYHELPHYVTTDDNNNQFARMALYALINCINRGPAPDTMKLIEPPANDTATQAAQDAYRERIAGAMRPMPAKLASAAVKAAQKQQNKPAA
jgi:hypothetical protein